MKVSEIMHSPVSIEDKVSLKEAAKTMSEKKVGSLIIIHDKKIVGIITENDIITNIQHLESSVSKVMSKNVITIDSQENISNAAIIMGKNKIKRLPVLKKDAIVGIITATDLLANSEEIDEPFFFD